MPKFRVTLTFEISMTRQGMKTGWLTDDVREARQEMESDLLSDSVHVQRELEVAGDWDAEVVVVE